MIKNERRKNNRGHALIIASLAVASIIALLLSVSANSFIVEDKQISDVSKQKIHQELRVQIQEKQKENITILVQLEKEDDLDKIADLVTKKEGVVIGEYKAGDVIAANIPANKIEEIAKDYSVKRISPNRVYIVPFYRIACRKSMLLLCGIMDIMVLVSR